LSINYEHSIQELLEICENIVHNNGKESGNRTKDAPDIDPGQKMPQT
jgi:hypothetical protein